MQLQLVWKALLIENTRKQTTKSHKHAWKKWTYGWGQKWVDFIIQTQWREKRNRIGLIKMSTYGDICLLGGSVNWSGCSHSIALNPVVHFSTCALVIAALLQWTSLQLLNYNELNVKQLFTSLKSNLVPNTCKSGLPLPIWLIINSTLAFLLLKLKEL